MRWHISSNEMFSSCSPMGALAAGVKMGVGKRLAFCKPVGKAMPHTVPLRWYSFNPEPVR